MRGRTAWDAKRDQYPFHEITRHITSSPRPEMVDPVVFGDFYRVPDLGRDLVYWGFLTQAAANLFRQGFDAAEVAI